MHASSVDEAAFKFLQQDLASRIRAARKSRGLSQEALALAAEVDRSYVSQLERGVANPSLAILARVSEVLGVTLRVSFDTKNDQASA